MGSDNSALTVPWILIELPIQSVILDATITYPDNATQTAKSDGVVVSGKLDFVLCSSGDSGYFKVKTLKLTVSFSGVLQYG